MDLSIIIPSRNEEFLARTIEDLLQNIEGDTEIIVVCDGNWPDPPVQDHERVTLVYHSESIGQRAATNEAVKLSQARFVMKVDAHCAFARGFDVVLMANCEHDWTVMPEMRNLHAFDWQCKQCSNRTYQGPFPTYCTKCDNTTDFEMVIVWRPRAHTRNSWYRFDRDLHFQYWKELKRRPESRGKLTETMSLLGACWMMHRERYWELAGLDERHGSWGQMGTELACKTWLSGGRLLTNRNTWFAHLFRTQKGFGFPYPNPGSQVRRAREHSKWLWEGGNWPKAIHPLSWLIEKFAPIPGWESGVPAPKSRRVPRPVKGVIYYTDNEISETMMAACQKQIIKGIKEKHIVSVSLEPIKFGRNISLLLERGYLTMFKQILAGLEASMAAVIFFCEHDILYHPSHFDFIPPRKDAFYYNLNVWKVRIEDGHALKVDDCKQTSGLCAWRELLLEHYRQRVERVERDGYKRSMGFEPGTHIPPVGIDSYEAESWNSEYPNIDIRHQRNLTPNRWHKNQFRNQKYTIGWTEADEVPGWGITKGRFEEVLNDLTSL